NLEDGTVSTSNKAFSSPGVCTKPPVIIPDTTTDIVTETEIITVPNVLISNSLKGNNLFRPVLTFTPKDYYLIISDRRGNILFKTKDYEEVWDGSGKGNGVYLWFLRVTTPTGKSISKTGTVTIINNR
ncbi:MAG: gliding motility-associated C-terminal domain-containing protein, partial [Bacteroidales bacterium]|nr:gliding motility-associated C-terminal domain-containing protein [Bacteroidales bacterium]